MAWRGHGWPTVRQQPSLLTWPTCTDICALLPALPTTQGGQRLMGGEQLIVQTPLQQVAVSLPAFRLGGSGFVGATHSGGGGFGMGEAPSEFPERRHEHEQMVLTQDVRCDGSPPGDRSGSVRDQL